MTEVSIGLPTGVVTFLFSDFEGSTQMLEEHRAEAGAVLARHHELVRAAVEDGSAVVFETVGDAVYGAFARPTDAIGAAVAIQRALAAEELGAIGELRARIAVHTGAVEPRGEHYFGAALFECARLQSLAHGGQTITSTATSSLAARDLVDGIELRPMGSHRLEVAVVGLPDDKWGETVGAFIRPAAGQSVDKQELFAYLREHLAPHKTPKQWFQVEQFPLTGSGKIQKFVLRDRWVNGEVSAL